jgi:hypothetical protein
MGKNHPYLKRKGNRTGGTGIKFYIPQTSCNEFPQTKKALKASGSGILSLKIGKLQIYPEDT